MKMTIITKPGTCLDANRTKAELHDVGVDSKLVVDDDRNKLMQAGYNEYPIVEPNNRLHDPANWQGYNPDKIRQYSQF